MLRVCYDRAVLKARDVIAGRYRLDAPIGEGAMGSVWRAEDQTLKRHVAIKFLFVRGARDPQAMVDQFLREARIAASVQHRNVIQTVDFGTVDDFQPFMVMELLNGESLGDRMARQPPLSHEQLIHIVSLTLRGLSAVHDAGIVHRDLKPQNVFLQRDADAVYPKILDFGISRSLNGGEDRPSAIATQEGMIVGTPDYMSPEQARGERHIDRRSDIYSMGVMLFEGLTGRLPFLAETVGDLIVQIMTTDAPHAIEIAPSVPRSLSDLVAQAMSRNREHRFADARALRRALLAAAETAWSHGGRIAASGPPGPVNLGQGAGLMSLPPPQPTAAKAGGAAARVPAYAAAPADASPRDDSRGGTWGDFEGLESPRIRDDNPPPPNAVPSIAPPKQQRLVARPNDPVLDLPAETETSVPLFLAAPPNGSLAIPAGALPVASAPAAARGRPSAARKPAQPERVASGAAQPPRAKAKAPRPEAVARNDSADMLDPLYAGRDMVTPELDYERMKGPAPTGRKSRERPSAAGRSEHLSPSRKTSVVWLRPALGAWLLPIAAAIAVAYLFYEPEMPSAPSAAQISQTLAGPIAEGAFDGAGGPVRARSRRERPGDAPPHLRDVVF